MANTVVIMGAGATKACGGPLTNEILPVAFEPHVRDEIKRKGYDDVLEKFLIEQFHVSPHVTERKIDDYPSLPLVMSLLDTALDRKQPLGPALTLTRLTSIREALEYIIFSVLEFKLRQIERDLCFDLLKILYKDGQEPIVISLNYDILLDNAMVKYGQERGRGTFPFYGCEIRTPTYVDVRDHYGKLFKLHGSLNWLYCPNCQRLDLGIAESGRRTVKVLGELYPHNPLERSYGHRHGTRCRECQTFVKPVLIAPTHRKDYRNPHIAQVWFQAEQILRRAEKAIFIGYSLPHDDVEVIYLLKRSLGHLQPSSFTVVEYADSQARTTEHPVRARYRYLFGNEVNWRTDGFAAYVDSLRVK